MSNAKHTPGPWKHIEEDGHNRIVGPDNEPLFMVGSYGQFGRNGPLPNRKTHISSICEEAANARLIAAAPETAAERDRLREVNAELLAALENLLAAANLFFGGDEGICSRDQARAAIAKATNNGGNHA